MIMSCSRNTATVVFRAGTPAVLAALLAMPPIAAAQSGDPLAPFLGTWSGVFTTQDNEFWGVEDFVCFPGCQRDVRDYIVGLLDDPANDETPVGALMGQTAAFAAEHLAEILTPVGKRIQAANNSGNDPKLHCQPYGYVRELTSPLPMIIRRDGENLVFQYEEWSLLRTVYMDGREHPEYLTPRLLGHSVGRLENGTLVIETVGVTPGWFSDYSHAGYSGELTGVERYTIKENPHRLEIEMTVQDPITLTAPYVAVHTWLYTPDVELLKDSCGDLPGKF